ncbi:MarR family winged helix-turn-helix transcriptional regulator [Pyxidicoccus xibeiensis]|uniref:MarR family winged helix-turn-helix transcriptional regulator n=1 Tax=Pyxidicoccus xibeiensis TaxID=2906759 RepID=UPI0020A70E65|nr:MarR family transcriptional regulator [Pyxidicoccus xibeiensis]MCP3138563.1 MarR family transcriptional regulator [Pyxidicoccus xibeiensis]
MDWTPELRAALENLGALKRCLRAATANAYGDLGLGEAQMKLLRHVAASPGVSQAELARATETDPALTGRALRGLLDRGVLRRKRSNHDRRAFIIELGPRGATLLARVNEANAKLVQQVSAPLDTRDLVDFDRIAKKLIAALDSPSAEASMTSGPQRESKRLSRARPARKSRQARS